MAPQAAIESSAPLRPRAYKISTSTMKVRISSGCRTTEKPTSGARGGGLYAGSVSVFQDSLVTFAICMRIKKGKKKSSIAIHTTHSQTIDANAECRDAGSTFSTPVSCVSVTPTIIW